MKIHLGPWTWSNDEDGGAWSPPAAGSAIDFRSLPEQSAPGETHGQRSGVGLFVVDDATVLDSDFEVLGSGMLDEIKADQRMRDLFPRRAGIALTGSTVAQLLWEALTIGSCPEGSEFARPLIPGGNRRLELHCGPVCRTEAFAWGQHAHTSRVRDVIRQDIRAVFEAAQRGELKDDVHHCRCLDYLCVKHGAEWQEFVPPDLVAEIPGRVPHDTTYTEDFVRANGAGVGNLLAWTAVTGTWSTVDNAATVSNGGGDVYEWAARAEHDLSASDMYAQATINGVTTGTAAAGTCVRFSASANTRYAAAARGTLTRIAKSVAGTLTTLQDGPGWTNGDRLRLNASGSTLNLLRNGAAALTATDTAITGHLRAGICGKASTTRITQFKTSDVLQGAPAAYFRRRRGLC